ncbi:MAG: hypothetical protein J6Q94_10485 [Clostridia bacterium]|nr:hypothetical protein [Clostridia bacterium]
MKKFLSIFVVVMMICLTACGSNVTEPATDADNNNVVTEQQSATDKNENDTAAATTETSTKKDDTVNEDEKVTVLPLADASADFSFLSGAGGWSTEMTLNKDGSFTGTYHDSEMGSVGEGYPNGSMYICEFSGKFGNFEKINDYSYKMTLTEIKTEKAAGEEWIEDEILYIASNPNGLTDAEGENNATEFILYLPETPVNELTEDFLSWWPYRFDAKTTLSCFGIRNVATDNGFFTAE